MREDLEYAIWAAIKPRLESLDLPVIKPGELSLPPTDHIRFSQIASAPVNDTLSAGVTIPRTLQLLLSEVVTAFNYDASRYLASQIASKFPQGHEHEMSFEGVRVVVNEPPFISEGYRDDKWWATPIRVRCQIHQR